MTRVDEILKKLPLIHVEMEAGSIYSQFNCFIKISNFTLNCILSCCYRKKEIMNVYKFRSSNQSLKLANQTECFLYRLIVSV